MKKKLIRLLAAAGALLALVLLARALWAGPQRAAARMMDHLAAGRLSRAAGCTVEETLNLEGKSWRTKRFYKQIFSTLQYQILSTEVDGDTAKVTAAVTMVDVNGLLTDASLESLDTGLLQSNSYYRRVRGRLRTGEVDYTLNTVTIYLKKTGGRWRVDMGDSGRFASAITGGMSGLIGY